MDIHYHVKGGIDGIDAICECAKVLGLRFLKTEPLIKDFVLNETHEIDSILKFKNRLLKVVHIPNGAGLRCYLCAVEINPDEELSKLCFGKCEYYQRYKSAARTDREFVYFKDLDYLEFTCDVIVDDESKNNFIDFLNLSNYGLGTVSIAKSPIKMSRFNPPNHENEVYFYNNEYYKLMFGQNKNVECCDCDFRDDCDTLVFLQCGHNRRTSGFGSTYFKRLICQ